MKKVYTIAAVIAVLVFCLFVLQYNSAQAEVKKDSGYISLSANKTKDVEPNVASITFAVETISADAQSASQQNKEISNKIMEALKAMSDSSKDNIKTIGFHVNANHFYEKNGMHKIKDYTAVNSISVETKDLNKVSKFIDTAIANGANRTDNLSYTFENSKNYCNELYPDVVKELREQANIIATAAGNTLDGLKHLNASCSTDTVGAHPRYMNKLVLDSAAPIETNGSTPVEFGAIKVHVYVNADFYVK